MTTITGSFERLAEHFSWRVSALRACLGLRDAVGEADTQAKLARIAAEVRGVEEVLRDLQRCVEGRRKGLRTVEALRDKVFTFNGRTERCKERLAGTETPPLSPSSSARTEDDEVTLVDVGGNVGMATAPERPVFTPTYANPCGDHVVESPLDSTVIAASFQELRRMGPLMFIPTLAPLTQPELDDVPRSMRSRVTLDMVHACTDAVQRAVHAKYKLLTTPPSRQTDAVLRAMRHYHEQETRDTKGCYFIVEKDLLTRSSVQLDASRPLILALLRHCGRLREVRGGGYTRYVLLPPLVT